MPIAGLANLWHLLIGPLGLVPRQRWLAKLATPPTSLHLYALSTTSDAAGLAAGDLAQHGIAITELVGN